jgi:hypothetical protein
MVEFIAGQRGWGNGKTMKLLSQSITVPNEAFTLLLLLNNWDKWHAEQGAPPRKIDALYTSSTQGNKKFLGWSNASIAKYNLLFKQIECDRVTDTRKVMEEMFLKSKQQHNNSKKGRPIKEHLK